MNRLDAIKELIARNTSVADFGEGISDELIVKAESEIGLPFPESYKWWLRNYSGGEIGGEEIYSIYGIDFDSPGDIVCAYKLHQKNPKVIKQQIPLCYSDIDGLFYFDATVDSIDNEYPVTSAATCKQYTKDFLQFIENRIKLFVV